MKKLSLNEKFIVFLIFYSSVIAWSPIFPGLFGIPTTVMYIPFLILAFILIAWEGYERLYRDVFFVCLFLSLVIFLSLILNNSIIFNRNFAFPFSIIVSLYVAKNRVIFSRLVDLWSIVALLSCFGAVFSFFYSFHGFSELVTFPNPNGKINVVFPGSFTNYRLANGIMRPSFIYDEPGAFSFFLTVIAICRVLLGKRQAITTAILCLGLITFSLMHVIVVCIYFLSISKLSLRNISILFFLCLSVLWLVISTYQMKEFSFFYDRFNFSNGSFQGDNRTGQISNFLSVVNLDIVLFGDYACQGFNSAICSSHGDISSSPVTPLYKGGLIWFFIQLFCHVVLVISAIKYRRLSYICIILTLCLLQRPFFTDLGYQLIIFIPLFYMLKRIAHDGKCQTNNYNNQL
ncbi:hypothetical protein NB600_02250 [Vibrio antiquarius]|uniref:hypothetical protein n=1 Tax=Vibrio antiquarius (strain Ex25) TaxID=150340 RepID=UPI00265CBB01|nr:hypothetical protein [Vibrio antiquarius]MCR9684645.1 hypothetical protein [Vibrio antiquarius]